MELEGWKLVAAALCVSVSASVLFWLLASAGLRVAGLLPQRVLFADELLGAAGDRKRLQHRRAGRELAVLNSALLVVVIVGLLSFLLLPASADVAVWALVIGALLALALLGGAVYMVARLVARRRRLRFAWAAIAAVGNVLKRLNLGGNRVFHDVAVDGNVIDHVVIGSRGVFAVKVVPRPVPKSQEIQPAAELRNGKLWMAGTAEARPVGEVARQATALAAALTRIVGHRVSVRSVLAIPGWQTAPNGEGHHLVLNENNLSMLTSWNPPEAHLMEEDCFEVQKFLHEASRISRLD